MSLCRLQNPQIDATLNLMLPQLSINSLSLILHRQLASATHLCRSFQQFYCIFPFLSLLFIKGGK